MIKALSPTTTPPVKLRPVTKQVPVHQWQEDLNYLENEVAFYQKLLRTGLHNCPESARATIHGLLDGFSTYMDETISNLKTQLTSIDLEKAEPSFLYSFQRKLERHLLDLRNLKKSVFPHVHNIQKMSIW